MGVTVKWDDSEQTIVRMTFSGHWTNEELHTYGLQAILMIRSVNHPVYEINDFRESDGLPLGVLWKARDLNQLRPANWAAGISVTQDGLAKSLLETFGLIYLMQRRSRLFIVSNDEEAYEIIHKLKQDNQVSS